MAKQQFSIHKALAAGAVAGTVSGLVKLGWENILPPRTPARDATNPPQQFLEQLGLPAELAHATFTYNGHEIPWTSLAIHFGFSTSLAMLYAVVRHYIPLAKLGKGTAWGLGVWSVAHLVAMPAIGTVPKVQDQPMEEHVSEALGHAVWNWVNELVIEEMENDKK
ncbi:YagU family protein [Schleiferilactobacillus harbinensis]|uniref:YagU family protein n=1 Tax=Schleiferilactobacillus harbinensis TaxID=304207 RepID=UPI00345EB6BB